MNDSKPHDSPDPPRPDNNWKKGNRTPRYGTLNGNCKLNAVQVSVIRAMAGRGDMPRGSIAAAARE